MGHAYTKNYLSLICLRLFVFAKSSHPSEVTVLAGDKARFKAGDQTRA